MNTLETIGYQLLPAVAYGDSAGLPFETKSSEEIAKRYGRIDRLFPTNENDYFIGQHDPGQTSDDLQLSAAVAEALITTKEFDIGTIALTHVEQYYSTPTHIKNGKPYPLGWGGSTVESVKRIIEGVDPLEAGSPTGTGNGILMKFSPLALWHAAKGISDTLRYEEADMLTRMTHNNPVAVVATRVHSDVMNLLVTDRNAEDLGTAIVEFALDHEQVVEGADREVSSALAFLATSSIFTQQEILDATDKKGFYVPQTLAMAYANFLSHRGNFKEVVYGAVNLGGDTDSIASISGTLELFASGQAEFPEDLTSIKGLMQIQELSKRFIEVALKKGAKDE